MSKILIVLCVFAAVPTFAFDTKLVAECERDIKIEIFDSLTNGHSSPVQGEFALVNADNAAIALPAGTFSYSLNWKDEIVFQDLKNQITYRFCKLQQTIYIQ